MLHIANLWVSKYCPLFSCILNGRMGTHLKATKLIDMDDFLNYIFNIESTHFNEHCFYKRRVCVYVYKTEVCILCIR